MAVLHALRTRQANVELRWVGGHRGIERAVLSGEGIHLERLVLRSLRTVDLSLNTVLDPLRLGVSVPQAVRMLRAHRPDVVFTTGGYVAIPMLLAATVARVPTVMWEGNMIPGRSVRATARLATALAVSFGETCGILRGRCYETGTPIRSLAGIDRAAARRRFGLEDPDRGCLLVFGGSQTVRRFSEAVSEALPTLVERYHLIYLTGERGYAEALRQRERLPEERRGSYRVYPFLREEMADALIAADLVVGRAGSSTLAEATAAGVPIVVVPYPHAGGHQVANARHLAEAGAALVIEDEAFDGAALLEAAAIIHDSERRARMREASRSQGRPGAARATSELLFALGERAPLPHRERIERIARGDA